MVTGMLAACAGPAAVTDEAQPAASAPQPGNWKVGYKADSITGSSPVAVLNFASSLNILTGKLFTGEMQLICYQKKPLILIGFTGKVGANRSASLAYRFDDKPGVEAQVRFLRTFRAVLIEDVGEVRRFLADLATANKLALRIDSFLHGRTNVIVAVHGAAHAIDAVLAACPLPSGQSV
jgi:hypothetical protein